MLFSVVKWLNKFQNSVNNSDLEEKISAFSHLDLTVLMVEPDDVITL